MSTFFQLFDFAALVQVIAFIFALFGINIGEPPVM